MALSVEKMGRSSSCAKVELQAPRLRSVTSGRARVGQNALRWQKLTLRARKPDLRTPVRCSASMGPVSPMDGGVGEGTAFPEEMVIPTHCMGQLSSSGGATMQRSKLNLQQEVRIFQPKTDDAGGGGGIGNRIFNGGGGGGDDSDDDEYQDDFGDDEEGDAKVGLFDLREALPELFDKATMEAILSEWYKSIVSLPAGLRMAVEMSVLSSAQLVRFLSMNYRPQFTRSLTRALPTEPSRAFVGRVMGDPSFMYKVALEQMLTIVGSVMCELRIRGDNFKREWKQVAASTAALCVANGSMVWLTAPSRAFGTTGKYAWQQALSKLPNHVFEKSGPLRRYTVGDRATSFALKAGQLAVIGLTTGALGAGLQKAAGAGAGAGASEGTQDPSRGVEGKALAPLRGPVVGLGTHMAVSSHMRYQAIAGVDRWLSQRCGHLGMVLGATTLVRVANAGVGEVSRTWFQGVNCFGGKKKDKGAKRGATRGARSALRGLGGIGSIAAVKVLQSV